MKISVVIPAYNEAKVLPGALVLLDTFLGPAVDRQVLVVDDGSTDGTAETVEALARADVQVLRLPENRGKGAAVRAGVLASDGDVVIVTDADGHYLHNRAEPYLAAVRSSADAGGGGDADIVLASRAHPLSRREFDPAIAWYVHRRRLMGRTFNLLVRWIVGLSQRDTQTGLKFFRGSVARELFRELSLTGFAYDVEILYRACQRGYRLREMPLVYYCPSAESKVTFWDPARMLLSLFRVRRPAAE